MGKSKFLFVSLLIAAAIVSCSKNDGVNMTQLLTPEGQLTQSFPTANNGGNVTCEEVAIATGCDFEYSSGKIDYYGNGGGTVGPITWTTDGTYVTWSSSKPISVAIIIKGGPKANVYFEGCDVCKSGSGTTELLSPPLNPNSGKPYGLSNITFCYNLCTPPPPPPTTKIIALKSFVNCNPYNPVKPWVVTGGGAANNYFIGCLPFVVGVKYPLYFGGDDTHQAGTLEIGNFNVADELLEVKIISTTNNVYFTNSYLYVGPTGSCNTGYKLYPYQKLGISAAVVIFDLPF